MAITLIGGFLLWTCFPFLPRTHIFQPKLAAASVIQDSQEDLKVFYINIKINDASAAIQDKVKKKIHKKQENVMLPSALKKKAASNLSSFVASAAPTWKVADMMSQKMVKVLPFRMKKKGISVVAERVFLEGSFYVLQLQVQHVDAMKLAENASEGGMGMDEDFEIEDIEAEMEKEAQEEKMTKSVEGDDFKTDDTNSENIIVVESVKKGRMVRFLGWFLKLIGVRRRSLIEDKILPSVLQAKMTAIMGDMIKGKMEGKRIEAEATVLPEKEEARFFFMSLRNMRSEHGQQKNTENETLNI